MQQQPQSEQNPWNPTTNPREYWEWVEKQGREIVDNFIHSNITNTEKIVGHLIAHLRKIVDYQSRELTIFRTMETVIRNQTVTPEQMVELLTRLAALRTEAASGSKRSTA